MRNVLPYVVIGVTAAIGLLSAAPVEAYKRTQTCDSFGTYECDDGETPKPISWPVRCVRYRLNDEGSSDFGSGDRLSEELQNRVVEAFQTWNEPSCSDFQAVQGDTTSNSTAEFRRDAGLSGNMNLVVWRDDKWPYEGSELAFAITSVSYSSETGTVQDADIEINSDTYEFDHLEESQADDPESKVDLQNTLVHEVGHFLGLAHPENIRDATMYGKATAGEIRKRELHPDDIDGLCAIYPAQQPPATCDDPEDFEPPTPLGEGDNSENEGICSVSAFHPSRMPIAAAWLAILLTGAGLRRRE